MSCQIRDVGILGPVAKGPRGAGSAMISPVDCVICGTRNAPGVENCVGCGTSLDPAGAAGGPGGAPPAGAAPAPPAPSGDAWTAPGTASFPPPGAAGPPGAPPPGYGPPGQYPSNQYPGGGQYPPDQYPSGGQAPGQFPAGSAMPPGQYPPGGAPPGYGPSGAYPGQPGGGGGRSPLLLVLAIIVVAALVGAATFVVLNRGGDDDQQVVLEPISMVQEDDFAGNLDVGESAGAAFAGLTVDEAVPDARVQEVSTGLAGRVVDGVEPAVYGGSRDTQVCDVETLVSFLTDPANEAKATAWADALDIEVSEIESYIGGLTSVRVRWDTRVTNHGFNDGEATPFQSLLQAGTAVMVDDTGVPRVKCNCGNPLGEPTSRGGTSESAALDIDGIAENPDDAWEGLDPAQAVAVNPGASVEAITLVDVDQGGLIERPIGSDGASKRDTGTGDVQLTLEWESAADLDLAVAEPDGTETYFGNPGPSPSGGELDVDSNIGCEDDDGVPGAVENIFWPTGDAPSGTYTVKVTGYTVGGADCGSGDYTLTITVAGEERTEQGSVADDEVDTFEFEVP